MRRERTAGKLKLKIKKEDTGMFADRSIDRLTDYDRTHLNTVVQLLFLQMPRSK
jgi:hypothetical protein